MFCPNCRAEYAPGFTRCSDCDVDLAAELPLGSLSSSRVCRQSPPPDVSAYVGHGDHVGPLVRYSLPLFLGLPFAIRLVVRVAHVNLDIGAAVATGLAALLVCWAIGDAQQRPARLALRVLVFVLTTVGYAVALWLLFGSPRGKALEAWVREEIVLVLVVGLLAQALLSPNAALRRLRQPLLRWRAPWHAYAVSLLAWPLLTVLVVELSRNLPGAHAEVAQGGAFIADMLRLGSIQVLWVGPWALAWFGFGVPMLLRRGSALATALVLGVLTWLLAFLPALTHGRLGGAVTYLNLGSALALAVVSVWLFQRARGSVWPVLLLQATTATSLLLSFSGDGFGTSDTGSRTALVTAQLALAAVLVVLDRMWARPEGAPSEPHSGEPLTPIEECLLTSSSSRQAPQV